MVALFIFLLPISSSNWTFSHNLDIELKRIIYPCFPFNLACFQFASFGSEYILDSVCGSQNPEYKRKQLIQGFRSNRVENTQGKEEPRTCTHLLTGILLILISTVNFSVNSALGPSVGACRL
jgi:hypothetical protein